MKEISLYLMLAFAFTATYAQENYSGVWQDQLGVHYSIHQHQDQIMLAKLNTYQGLLPINVQGDIFSSNNPMDLAISGYGLFVLIKPDGSRIYTRVGKFHLSSNSEIVDENGYRLLTQKSLNGPYQLLGHPNSNAITISENGIISLSGTGNDTLESLDRILLASIASDTVNFSEYPLDSIDPKLVSLFYPGDASVKPGNHLALIFQYTLENRTNIEKNWQAYSGKVKSPKQFMLESLDPSEVKLKLSLELNFINESTAVLKHSCSQNNFICNVFKAEPDKILTKWY